MPTKSPTAESSSQRQRLVIIGAGMATHALLQKLEAHDGLDRYDVTVIGEEPRAPYDRVNLTDYFSGKTADELLLAPAGWHQRRGVQLKTSCRATRIDRSGKIVHAEDGSELPYELLIFATGSRPFVPPIPGVDLPGVFVYRTVEDLEAIQAYAARSRSAGILGGGLLGLEAGKAALDMGLEAHVFEVAPGLMPRQLNSEAAELLRQEVESLGVSVHPLRRAESIEARGDDRLVHFAGHETVALDMVIISAGIRPRDELARDTGLTCGERGGIAVDQFLQTEDPSIYAIGECVSFDDKHFGLVGPCYEMAEVVAKNLSNPTKNKRRLRKFSGQLPASRLKLMGVDVSTLGVPIGEAPGASLIVNQGASYCRSLIVENSRLIGAIGVGDWPERERLSGAIANRQRVRSKQIERFRETGSLWLVSEGVGVMDWPAAATVCSCMNVTRGQLTDAIRAGASDAPMLAEATGASTICGSCSNLLCELAGQPLVATGQRGRNGLLAASVFAALIAPTLFAMGPIPFADSVQSEWRSIDFLWKDSFAKQVTGYTLLGVAIVSLVFSLRKRLSWFKLGDFTLWRGVHGILGAITLLGFIVHTGMRLGHNFTFALALTFLGINLIGAFTGLTAALESRMTGVLGRQLRAWRPRLTQAHIWMFWPLPALVLFHVISVYYY